MRFLYKCLILFVYSIFLSNLANAKEVKDYDASLALGGVFGEIAKTLDDGENQTFKVGGIPIALMLNRDLGESWTAQLQIQVVMDMINEQVMRQGFATAIYYHVFGGSRRIQRKYEPINLVATSPYNISLILRAGVFNFAATDKNNPRKNLSGGVWDTASGFEIRYSLSDRDAIGFDFLRTLFTFPASVTRISTQTNELLFFWRFEI